MASELKSNNARSPRFSTSRALGFRGGSVGAGGNLQQPTFQQVEGTQTRAPGAGAAPSGDERPAISQFNAAVPKGPSALGMVGNALAGEGIKAGVKGIRNALTPAGADATGVVQRGAAPSGAQIGGPSPDRYAGITSTPLSDLGESLIGPRTGTTLAPGLQPSGAEAFAVSDPYAGITATELPPLDVGGAVDPGSFYSGEGVDSLVGDAGSAGLETAGMPGFGGPLAIGNAVLNAGPLIETAGNVADKVAGALGLDDCFITEAVMSAGGQGDTAPELEALRQFRDEVLAATPQGQALIAEYEAIAPIVVEAVVQRPDAMQIFQQIDAQFINPSVEAINQGNFQKALQIYAQMISFVTPFAVESAESGMAMPGQDQDSDAMEQMGQHAAIVGYNPDMAADVTGGMDISMMDQDPTGYDGGPQMPLGAAGGEQMQGQVTSNPMMGMFAKPRY